MNRIHWCNGYLFKCCKNQCNSNCTDKQQVLYTHKQASMAVTHCLLLFFLATLGLCLVGDALCNDELSSNLSSSVNSASEDCPTWYLHAKRGGKSSCFCGPLIHNKVRCENDYQVGLLYGNCMTYTDNQTLVGLCPYTAHNSDPVSNLYTTMPKNLSELNEFMCGWNNRTGLLCSQCKEGLSLAALSYERVCMECSDKSAYLGIFLFLVLAFVPTTLFFLVVLCCSIDISSGPMNAFLTIIQTVLIQFNQNPTDFIFKSSSNPLCHYPMILLLTFYGVWLLDFFRYVIPPFCISKSLTLLQTGALEYMVAVYPLILIVTMYICIELYDNENKLMRLLWTPFGRISKCRCFKDLNIKYSLISSFVTFLELTNAKIFSISKGFLNYAYVKNASGDSIVTVMMENASVQYMSATHIPYVVIALFMSTIFVILPLLLLLLYPTRWFQKLLGRFPGLNWLPLRAFMDIFQGCYKNGTDGTNDCRYFAAFHFIFCIVILTPIDNNTCSAIKVIVAHVVFIFLIAFFRPYRNDAYNMLDIFFFFLYFVCHLFLLCATYDGNLSLDLLYLPFSITFVYFCSLVIAKMTKVMAPRLYGALEGWLVSGAALKIYWQQ